MKGRNTKGTGRDGQGRASKKQQKANGRGDAKECIREARARREGRKEQRGRGKDGGRGDRGPERDDGGRRDR